MYALIILPVMLIIVIIMFIFIDKAGDDKGFDEDSDFFNE